MANECKVFEQIVPRDPTAPVRTVPFLARQQLSSGGLSAAFSKSTRIVTIVSSIAGTVDFTSTAGVDPTGSLAPFPINANQEYDFSVRGGTKVYFT
jgi:hypothetical protein